MEQGTIDMSGESSTENDMDAEEMITKMRLLNKKFRNSCSQVILLNNEIEYLQTRYDRAVRLNKRSYRYFLRLRLATLEGIRNMFYEYACRRADELDEMQDTLVHEGVIDSDYDMDATDSDTEQAHDNLSQNVDTSADIENTHTVNFTQLNPGQNTAEGALNMGSSEFVSSSGAIYYTGSSNLGHNLSGANNVNMNQDDDESQDSEQDVVIEGALDTVVMDTQGESGCANIIQTKHVTKDSQNTQHNDFQEHSS